MTRKLYLLLNSGKPQKVWNRRRHPAQSQLGPKSMKMMSLRRLLLYFLLPEKQNKFMIYMKYSLFFSIYSNFFRQCIPSIPNYALDQVFIFNITDLKLLSYHWFQLLLYNRLMIKRGLTLRRVNVPKSTNPHSASCPCVTTPLTPFKNDLFETPAQSIKI